MKPDLCWFGTYSDTPHASLKWCPQFIFVMLRGGIVGVEPVEGLKKSDLSLQCFGQSLFLANFFKKYMTFKIFAKSSKTMFDMRSMELITVHYSLILNRVFSRSIDYWGPMINRLIVCYHLLGLGSNYITNAWAVFRNTEMGGRNRSQTHGRPCVFLFVWVVVDAPNPLCNRNSATGRSLS